jgi:hypothetical protein
MSDRPRAARVPRGTAYLLLGIAAALATPTTDAMTMLLVWLAGVAPFELGFLAHRRYQGSGRR